MTGATREHPHGRHVRHGEAEAGVAQRHASVDAHVSAPHDNHHFQDQSDSCVVARLSRRLAGT